MWKYWAIALAIGGCSGMALGTDGAPANQDFSAQWQSMRQRLGASDYAQREAAMAELGTWPYAFYPELEKVLTRETDPEIRERLARGMDEIAVQKVAHQPNLSIDFDNATLQRIVNQLNGALGDGGGAGPRIAPSWESRDKFTLHVKDVPFWEIIKRLNEQHPLVITGASGWMLTPAYNGMQGFGYTGIMAAWATVNRVPVGVNPAGPAVLGQGVGGAGAKSWNMAITLAADPRVNMARCSGVRWFDVRDDAAVNGGHGNDLMPALELQAAAPLGGSTFRTNLTLRIPDAPGKKIRLMRGEASVSVITREEVDEVPDVRQMMHGPGIHVPQGTLAVRSLEKYGESMQLDVGFERALPPGMINVAQVGNGPAAANVIIIQGPAGAQMFMAQQVIIAGQQLEIPNEIAPPSAMALRDLPVTVQVVVDGKVAGTYVVTSDLSVRFPATTKPVKLLIRHAAGVKEARLPVELRDVTLP